MASLTSCYFCGDAVGASLDDYDLPADAPADRQVAVTLCADCKSKLDELLELVVPAGAGTPAEPVAGDPEPVFGDASDGEPGAEGSDDGRSDDGGSAAGDAPADVPQESAFDNGGEPPVEPSGDAAQSTPGDAPTGRRSDTAPESRSASTHESRSETPAPESESTAEPAADAAAGSAPDPSGETHAESGETDDAPDPGFEDGISFEEQPTAEARDGTDDSAAGSGDATAVTREPPESRAESDPAGRTAPDADGASDPGPLADVSARTYNRVVRLLQNREFPVDRSDFEMLASSAYELEREDVAAALDGAIEKGLLAEREGMLRRPE